MGRGGQHGSEGTAKGRAPSDEENLLRRGRLWTVVRILDYFRRNCRLGVRWAKTNR